MTVVFRQKKMEVKKHFYNYKHTNVLLQTCYL
jgi:hypothetical protein